MSFIIRQECQQELLRKEASAYVNIRFLIKYCIDQGA